MRPFHRRLGRAFRAAWAEMSQRSVFDGAGFSRLLADFVSKTVSADTEIKGDIRTLRGRARSLGRNNSYVKRFFRLLQNNVIGPYGIRLEAQVMSGDEADEETNKKIEHAWNLWAKKPVTVDGKLSLRRLERLLIKTIACDGEAFVRIWRTFERNRYGIALQTIDADLIDETYNRAPRPGVNEIRMGVEVDSFGAPVGYWVWKASESSGIDLMRERYFVPANEMLHLYDPDRVNQTRGVTWVHSVMVTAQMLNEYEKSEAVAARVSAAKMGWFEKKEGDFGAGGAGEPTKKPATMNANPGRIEFAPDGYEFKAWEPDHPTQQFGAFVKQLLRKIASGFSVFYNVLANDAEGVTYSTMRSFSLVEHDDWRSITEDFIDMWRERLYEAWLESALATGMLALPRENFARYLDVVHAGRGWQWIDPESESNAAVTRIQNNLDSEFDVCRDMGVDFEDVCKKRQRAKKMLEKYGLTSSGTTSVKKPDPDKDDKEELANAKTVAEWDGNGKKSEAELVRLVSVD